jgi:hypothetical protein
MWRLARQRSGLGPFVALRTAPRARSRAAAATAAGALTRAWDPLGYLRQKAPWSPRVSRPMWPTRTIP